MHVGPLSIRDCTKLEEGALRPLSRVFQPAKITDVAHVAIHNGLRLPGLELLFRA